MAELIEDGKLVREDRMSKIRTAMEGQHAIHGIFGKAFQHVGGEERFFEWVDENYGTFIKLFVKMTPGLAPTQGFQGDLNLHIHHSLGVTELDGEQEEVN